MALDPIAVLGGVAALIAASTPGWKALRDAKRQEKETNESISAKAFEQAELFYDKTLQRYREELDKAQAALVRADEQLQKYRAELEAAHTNRKITEMTVQMLTDEKRDLQNQVDDLKARVATLEAERDSSRKNEETNE